MKKIIKALTRITMYCMVALALYPYDSIAQPSNSHNGEVHYYRRTTHNEYGYIVYAIMFMDGYLVSYSIHSSESIFLQSKKDNDINGLKSYLLQKLNNKTDRMQFLMTTSNGETIYGDDYYHWTFTKDYSKFSQYNEESIYYGVDPFDEFSKIELKDIIKY